MFFFIDLNNKKIISIPVDYCETEIMIPLSLKTK